MTLRRDWVQPLWEGEGGNCCESWKNGRFFWSDGKVFFAGKVLAGVNLKKKIGRENIWKVLSNEQLKVLLV